MTGDIGLKRGGGERGTGGVGPRELKRRWGGGRKGWAGNCSYLPNFQFIGAIYVSTSNLNSRNFFRSSLSLYYRHVHGQEIR